MSTGTAAVAHGSGWKAGPDVFDMAALKAEAAAMVGQGSSYSACHQAPHAMLKEVNMNPPARADRDVDAAGGNGAARAAGASGGGGGDDRRSNAAARAAASRGVALTADEKENLNPVCPVPCPHRPALPGPRRLAFWVAYTHPTIPSHPPLRIHVRRQNR